jgi:hypothetical protein
MVCVTAGAAAIGMALGGVSAPSPNEIHSPSAVSETTQSEVVTSSQGPQSGEFKAWTRGQANGTQVKFYAKYPQPGQKIQFMAQNGNGAWREIGWKRIGSSDLDASGNYRGLTNEIYFVRTFDLTPGSFNRLRVDVDGKTVWGSVRATWRLPVSGDAPEGVEASWISAVESVRAGLISNSNNKPHPLDFAASPSTSREHAAVIRGGVEFALRAWAPFISSDRPLAMTVVHPNDKAWFLQRWDKLGKDNTGEFWWNLAAGGGGGAVGVTPSGIPNMYFMASSKYPPPSSAVDYYVHEVTHFFEALSVQGVSTNHTPCWLVEGPATFIGFAMTHPDNLDRTLAELSDIRVGRARGLVSHYSRGAGLFDGTLRNDILNFPSNNDRCQHTGPQLGYNLGMFVAEKLISDFEFKAFVDISTAREGRTLPEAFRFALKSDYENWVDTKLLPYLQVVLPRLAQSR